MPRPAATWAMDFSDAMTESAASVRYSAAQEGLSAGAEHSFLFGAETIIAAQRHSSKSSVQEYDTAQLQLGGRGRIEMLGRADDEPSGLLVTVEINVHEFGAVRVAGAGANVRLDD